MTVIYTKEKLIEKLHEIRNMGWIANARHGNTGGIGNTLEDLLGIAENNLPIPNAAEWELKTQRKNTKSLTTLFHMEPSPTALKFVPQILLPYYGWPHKEAGKRHTKNERSFRQTIFTGKRTDRGFKIIVDKDERKILVSFDAESVNPRHKDWLKNVKDSIGLTELNPQPYWGFDDLYHKAGIKLHNCFYVVADVKKEDDREFFKYEKILKLSYFSQENLIQTIDAGDMYVDFDARTGHNHGTKFRFRCNKLPDLYEAVEEL